MFGQGSEVFRVFEQSLKFFVLHRDLLTVCLDILWRALLYIEVPVGVFGRGGANLVPAM